MKRFYGMIAMLFATFSLFSCAVNGNSVCENKKYVTKEMRVDNFSELEVNGSATVVYNQTNARPGVVIHTSENILPLLSIHVKKGKLYIGFKEGTSVCCSKLTINVNSPQLTAATLYGSGDIVLEGQVKTEKLQLQLFGSGDVTAHQLACTQHCQLGLKGSGDVVIERLQCASLDANLSGSGDLVVKGVQAQQVDGQLYGSGDVALSGATIASTYQLKGSGDLDASQLKSDRVEAVLSGSGDMLCHAVHQLNANVSGSGRISYRGNPQQVVASKHVHKL